MKIFCIPEFKSEYDKLVKKKSYSSIEETLFDFFNGKNINDLRTGTNLSTYPDIPFVKKRLQGRGGFRIYYFLLIKDDNVYLSFLHPKTGPLGIQNLKDWKKYLNLTIEYIKSGNLYQVELDKKGPTCKFKKLDKG